MSLDVSIISQAMDARHEVIQDIINSNATENKMLASQYKESVLQWIVNKQQVKVGTPLPPIPVPQASWITVPHVYTDTEKLYDAAFPGIAPLVDDSQTGPPVALQYVEPTTPPPPPPGTVSKVGAFQREDSRFMNGVWTDVYVFTAPAEDNMMAGSSIPYFYEGKSMVLHKVKAATPWGMAQWYEGVVV